MRFFAPHLILSFVASSSSILNVLAYNFPLEGVQLSDVDGRNNSDFAFGTFEPRKPVATNRTRCKVWPGDGDWPSEARWNALNASLEGALIKGVPPAYYCYEGAGYDEAKCTAFRRGFSQASFMMEQPASPFIQWTTGNACPLPPVGNKLNYTCSFDGTPAYVVDATTVKQIQLAVNFARNNNIRLVIKNTGHDFLGRSAGGGSIEVWTHHLKSFKYEPSLRIGRYRGPAARVAAGLQTWELHNYMRQYNFTVPAPGGQTVGPFGGYVQGGGHSILASYHGLMSDQVLSYEVVTADGRFVHVDADENDDLFWALRGGGASTFGIVTSVVIKVHPPLSITRSQFLIATGSKVSNATFWSAVSAYFAQLPRVCDAKGTGWNYINTNVAARTGDRSFTLQGVYYLPTYTPESAEKFLTPLYKALLALGINTTAQHDFFPIFPDQGFPLGAQPSGPAGNSRFGSRLLPHSNFEDPSSALYNATMATIREFVEFGGYAFHSVDYTATEQLAGSPGADSAVPSFHRDAIAHATLFDTQQYGPNVSPALQILNHKRLDTYVQKIRDVTPDSGAYGNEADTEEPLFWKSFYAENWGRLSRIKRVRDPWGLFYMVTGVGSQEWKVQGVGGLPYQSGRLCRV